MLNSSLPDVVKINNTIHDNRLKSKLTTNKTIRFTKKSFLYTVLGFVESHSGVLGDISSFIQLIQGSYKSDKPFSITGIDKVLLKCDCFQGGIVCGTREPILYSFALNSPPGYEVFETHRILVFEKKNSVFITYIILFSK